MDKTAVAEVKMVPCPECKKLCKPIGLAVHRRIVHGVVGTAPSTVRRHRNEKAKSGNRTTTPQTVARRKLNGSHQCPVCPFVAKWTGGLTKHMAAAHPKVKPGRSTKIERTAKAEIVRSNGQVHTEEAAGQGHSDGGISETVLAIALGRFQGLCREISTEFDLPPRLFASRLGELVYRSQVRTTLGHRN